MHFELYILFFVMAIVDLIGAGLILLLVAQNSDKLKNKYVRLGLAFACFGLVGQLVRDIYFLTTGESPTDSTLPIWAFKDIALLVGACVIPSFINDQKATDE
jgi:hypothetical protein